MERLVQKLSCTFEVSPTENLGNLTILLKILQLLDGIRFNSLALIKTSFKVLANI